VWHCGYGRLEVAERVWQGRAGAWQRPFAAQAGVSGRGCSRRLRRLAGDPAPEEPFGRAAARLDEHHGVTLAPSTLRLSTLRHAGALAGRQLARAPVRTLPAAGAAALVVEADGTLLPQVEFAPGPGDRRKLRRVAYREVRLLAAQAAGQAHAHHAVSFGDPDEVGGQWQPAALQAGWAASTCIHALGDGAERIAGLARTGFGVPGRYLPDLCHVGGSLGAAAPAGEADCLSRQKAALCQGRAAAVIAAPVARREPAATPEPAAPVRAAHRYLANRSDRLDYPAALARGLPIGSGLIESGHKHVLQKRLKLPGAAWLRTNSAAIARARVVRANAGWSAYWASLLHAQN